MSILGEESTTVVIAEDQALMREGLASLMEAGGFRVLATAADGDELVRKAGAHRPDVVVTDIRMPPGNLDEGLRAALAIREARPEIGVVLLSQHVQRRFLDQLIEGGTGEGGLAYLLKQRIADADTFCADVRRVASGATVLDHEIVKGVLAASRDPLLALTERQKQVLELMAQGRSNSAIADELVITEKAAGKHVSNVYETLGLKSRPDEHRRVLAVMRYLAP